MRVFENRLLRRIFEPKREEMPRVWRRLHNEELHNLYPSPNIVRVITFRTMRGVGHVEQMRQMNNAYKILVGKSKGKDHSEDPGVGGKIILEWMLGK